MRAPWWLCIPLKAPLRLHTLLKAPLQLKIHLLCLAAGLSSLTAGLPALTAGLLAFSGLSGASKAIVTSLVTLVCLLALSLVLRLGSQ